MKLGPYELGPNDTPENGIYTGDARELARAIPDESIALSFADPPYWVGFDYGNGRNDAHMEYIEPAWLVSELRRISSTVCITPGIVNLYDYPRPDWIMCWYKPGSTRRSMVLNGFNIWEPVLVYGNPGKRVWQDAINLPNAINIHGGDADFFKCPKHLNLLSWLVESFTEKNDIVFDPTCGSGTTPKAAKMLQRHYLAFEIDPATADMARERVRNTQPPLPLVMPEQGALL